MKISIGKVNSEYLKKIIEKAIQKNIKKYFHKFINYIDRNLINSAKKAEDFYCSSDVFLGFKGKIICKEIFFNKLVEHYKERFGEDKIQVSTLNAARMFNLCIFF